MHPIPQKPLSKKLWRHLDEERRYFPEWAERSAVDGEELEAERNSYLAGGYAEEFGYCSHNGFARGVRIYDGVSVEESATWFMQRNATHPGYPEKSKPLEDFVQSSEVEIAHDTNVVMEDTSHPSQHDFSILKKDSRLAHEELRERTRSHWKGFIWFKVSSALLSWSERLRTGWNDGTSLRRHP